MPGRCTAEIIARRSFGCATELVAQVDTPFAAEPGQFVHVRCEGPGLVLRRPYSLYDLRERAVSLLVREVGSGSAWLCSAEVGQELDFLGPLGSGFDVDGRGRKALVAGGTGIAPIRFLASRLRERGIEAVVFWGVDSEDEYRGLAGVLEGELHLNLATMDGSAGHVGSVVDLFKRSGMGDFTQVYACGPRGMLAGLAESISSGGLADLQVCMEERMACGVGACRGCVVPAASPAGGYLTACRDGPVFKGKELDWRRING